MKMPWTTPLQPPPVPQVLSYKLENTYNFMYNVAVFSDQQKVYLFLDHQGPGVMALVFEGGTFKFGTPNDEVLGGHSLAQFGLGFYDFFEVLNSPWIDDLCRANRVHPRHSDAMFKGVRHFIATFKDATFEVASRKIEERKLSAEDVQALISSGVPGLMSMS
jgi:hypothetical protein